MEPVCRWLDQQHQVQAYSLALQAQQAKMREPELTPSAMMMQDMRAKQTSYYDLVAHYSAVHRDDFKQRRLTAEQQRHFQQMHADSQRHLAVLEAENTTDFDTFLADYFASVTQAADTLPAEPLGHL